MGTYVTGVLRDNRWGATDESDHVLQLEHESGESFIVFCPPNLCDDVVLDREYELIIRGTAFASPETAPDDCLRYYETKPSDSYSGWEGKVVEVGKRFQPGEWPKVRPALLKGRWLVVATRLGRIIVRSRILRQAGVSVKVGGLVRFGGCRFDLYAIA